MSSPRALSLLLCLALTAWASGQDRAACLSVYGLEADSGALYRVDLAGDFGLPREPVLLATPAESLAVVEPDGLAYDDRTGRLYFAGSDGAGGSSLYAYDLATATFQAAGPVHGRIAGATFLNGSYHYIVQGTDELRKVFLTREGTVFAESSVAHFGLGAGLQVEDLAAHDGILFGSSSSDGQGLSARLFSYDPVHAVFETLSTSSGTFLQLAFANDRGLATLFGSSRDDGDFYEIDHLPWGDGATRRRFTFPGLRLSDLAGTATC